MSAPRIILSGYILSEKRTVFTYNIPVLQELAVYYSVVVVVVVSKLSTAVLFLNLNKSVIQIRFFPITFYQCCVRAHVCARTHTREEECLPLNCCEHLQLLTVWSILRTEVPSLDDSLFQISYIMANFPLRVVLSKHSVSVKAVLLSYYQAYSLILPQRPPSPALEPGRDQDSRTGWQL